MALYLLALLLGVVAGLRALTAPAAASWAAYLGTLPVHGTVLSFMGATVTPYILTVLACAELVTDKLPKTPSRKVPMQFGTRVVTGALAGATVGASGGILVAGLLLGVVGAVIGTLGGSAARGALVAAIGRDLPAALIEDVVAVGGAALALAVLA
jgi:uncharacterized membrane protein